MTENQQSQFQFDFDELMNDDNDNIENEDTNTKDEEDIEVDETLLSEEEIFEINDSGVKLYRRRFIPTDEIDISVGLDNLSLDERVRLAERGVKEDLDILMDDEDYRVRELVAFHGYSYHLNRLVHDTNSFVRWQVLGNHKKKHLEILSKDHDPEINMKAKQLLAKK